MHASWAEVVGLRHGDRYLLIYPLFHTAGLKSGLLASLLTGTTLLPHLVFDPPSVMEAVQTERITMLPGPPAIYQTILNADVSAYDFSSLRLAVTGAAVVPVELVVQIRDQLGFDCVVTGYGLTETTGIVAMCRHDDDPEIIAHTSGRPIPGVEMRIVDADGNEVPTGEPGEIVTRGYQVMIGYFDQNPAATAETVDPDGWLHTGDVGYVDATNNVTITDRIKDMFIVGGFNAYPAEIEGLMLDHPDLAQVTVVGVPDHAHGRGRDGVRRAGSGPRRRSRRGARMVTPTHGQLQGTALPRGGRRPSAQRQRQGAEVRAPPAAPGTSSRAQVALQGRRAPSGGDDVDDGLGLGPSSLEVAVPEHGRGGVDDAHALPAAPRTAASAARRAG